MSGATLTDHSAPAYRFHAEPLVRAHLERHFEGLASAIVQAFGAARIAALSVTGAPGRGETTAKIEGEQLIVYSDYDLLVLVDVATEADHRLARQLSDEWSTRLRPEGVLLHVDIACLGTRELREMAGTQAARDIFHASTLLRGIEPARLMPDLVETPLHRDEPLRLVVNRLGGSLELLFPDLVIEGRGASDDRRLLESIYQSEKHVADAATALLMTRGEYSSTYRGRAELIRRRSEIWASLEEGPWLRDAALRAIELKLTGNVRSWAAVATERGGDLRTVTFTAWCRSRRALAMVLPTVLAHASGRATFPSQQSHRAVRGSEVIDALPWTQRWRGALSQWLTPLESDTYRQRGVWGALIETALALPESRPQVTESWSTWQLERCAEAHRLLDLVDVSAGAVSASDSPWERWRALRARAFLAWRGGVA